MTQICLFSTVKLQNITGIIHFFYDLINSAIDLFNMIELVLVNRVGDL